MENPVKSYNLCFKTTEEIQERISLLGKQIHITHPSEVKYFPDNEHLPHITSIGINLSNENNIVPQVIANLERELDGKKKFKTYTKRFHQRGKYALLAVQKTGKLFRRHTDTLMCFHGMFSWKYPRYSMEEGRTARELGLIEYFGSPYVEALYYPHFTVAAFYNKKFRIDPNQFMPEHFAIPIIGMELLEIQRLPDGSNQEILIRSFPFSN